MTADPPRTWFRVWLTVTVIGLVAYLLAWRGVDWNPERGLGFLSAAMWWGWVPLLAWPIFTSGTPRIVVTLGLVVAFLPLSLTSFVGMRIGDRDQVMMWDAPAGDLAFAVTSSSSFFFGQDCIQARHLTAAGLILQPLGDPLCATNHDGDYFKFATRSARFERVPERGLIAFVADSVQVATGDGKLYLELYRRLGPLVIPLRVAGQNESPERDRAIRELLSGAAR
jgi:hypothetical protein